MKLSGLRIGSWVLAVGAGHLAATPIFFGDALRSVLDAGVLFSVDAEPEVADLRASGFWYFTSGLAVVTIGALSRHAERELGSPPPVMPAALAGLGLWGVLLDPRGGFWVFFPIAALAQRRLRSARWHAVEVSAATPARGART